MRPEAGFNPSPGLPPEAGRAGPRLGAWPEAGFSAQAWARGPYLSSGRSTSLTVTSILFEPRATVNLTWSPALNWRT